jgi:SAM-dependent methyltransferase
MISNNPNDITANIYDIFTRPLKGPEVTNLEFELVKSLAPIGSKILDIGCGTGRHAILLAQNGYIVTGIDSSKEMLKVARQKSEVNFSTCNNTPPTPPRGGNKGGVSNPQYIKADVLTYKLKPNSLSAGQAGYNLITLFWNSFNEICLTKKDAIKLLNKLKKSLKVNGKILLNMDREEWIKDLKDFTTEYEKDGFTYTQYWSIKKFSKKTNLTTSEEKITVTNKEVEVIHETKSLIKQRWWSKKELKELCQEMNLTLEQRVIKNINENYYVIKKVV